MRHPLHIALFVSTSSIAFAWFPRDKHHLKVKSFFIIHGGAFTGDDHDHDGGSEDKVPILSSEIELDNFGTAKNSLANCSYLHSSSDENTPSSELDMGYDVSLLETHNEFSNKSNADASENIEEASENMIETDQRTESDNEEFMHVEEQVLAEEKEYADSPLYSIDTKNKDYIKENLQADIDDGVYEEDETLLSSPGDQSIDLVEEDTGDHERMSDMEMFSNDEPNDADPDDDDLIGRTLVDGYEEFKSDMDEDEGAVEEHDSIAGDFDDFLHSSDGGNEEEHTSLDVENQDSDSGNPVLISLTQEDEDAIQAQEEAFPDVHTTDFNDDANSDIIDEKIQETENNAHQGSGSSGEDDYDDVSSMNASISVKIKNDLSEIEEQFLRIEYETELADFVQQSSHATSDGSENEDSTTTVFDEIVQPIVPGENHASEDSYHDKILFDAFEDRELDNHGFAERNPLLSDSDVAEESSLLSCEGNESEIDEYVDNIHTIADINEAQGCIDDRSPKFVQNIDLMEAQEDNPYCESDNVEDSKKTLLTFKKAEIDESRYIRHDQAVDGEKDSIILTKSNDTIDKILDGESDQQEAELDLSAKETNMQVGLEEIEEGTSATDIQESSPGMPLDEYDSRNDDVVKENIATQRDVNRDEGLSELREDIDFSDTTTDILLSDNEIILGDEVQGQSDGFVNAIDMTDFDPTGSDSAAFVDRLDLADAYDHDKDTEASDVGTARSGEVNQENKSTPEKIHGDGTAMATSNEILGNKLGYSVEEVQSMKPSVASVLSRKMLKRPKNGLPSEYFEDDVDRPEIKHSIVDRKKRRFANLHFLLKDRSQNNTRVALRRLGYSSPEIREMKSFIAEVIVNKSFKRPRNGLSQEVFERIPEEVQRFWGLDVKSICTLALVLVPLLFTAGSLRMNYRKCPKCFHDSLIDSIASSSASQDESNISNSTSIVGK